MTIDTTTLAPVTSPSTTPPGGDSGAGQAAKAGPEPLRLSTGGTAEPRAAGGSSGNGLRKLLLKQAKAKKLPTSSNQNFVNHGADNSRPFANNTNNPQQFTNNGFGNNRPGTNSNYGNGAGVAGAVIDLVGAFAKNVQHASQIATDLANQAAAQADGQAQSNGASANKWNNM